MTEAQQRRIAMSIGALIALLGITYYLDVQDTNAARTRCLAKYPPQRCECMISVIQSGSSFLRSMPLFGRLIFAPSDAQLKEISNRAARVC